MKTIRVSTEISKLEDNQSLYCLIVSLSFKFQVLVEL